MKRLPAEDMSDTRFMSADAKRKVLRQWLQFLKSGLTRDKFTRALYDHLIQHCSFIAHYDISGFYHTYFIEGDDICHFLNQFDSRKGNGDGIPPSIEYGMTMWATCPDYGDINRAMVRLAESYIPILRQRALEQQKAVDLSAAEALLRKHGYKVSIS